MMTLTEVKLTKDCEIGGRVVTADATLYITDVYLKGHPFPMNRSDVYIKGIGLIGDIWNTYGSHDGLFVKVESVNTGKE